MSGYNLLSSDHFHVILHPDKKHGLIINRIDESISTINYDDAKELSNLTRRGLIYGIVGKYLGKKLVLIKDRSYVGTLYEPATRTEHHVYVITQLQVIDIPLSSKPDPEPNTSSQLDQEQTGNDSAKTHDSSDDQTSSDYFSSLPVSMNTNSFNSIRNPPWNPFNKISNPFKNRNPVQNHNHSNVINTVGHQQQSNEPRTSSENATNPNVIDDDIDRLTDEMIKLFNGTNSFYFSPTLDLTNRFSRKKRLVKRDPSDSIWKTADERFFWNKYMLKDLLELSESNNDANCFVCIILQGYISMEQVEIPINPVSPPDVERGQLATSVNFNSNDCDQVLLGEKINPFEDKILENSKNRIHQLALISRRSVLQAGTRYRRRGCDVNGNCANFVETEQIFRSGHHFNSVILLRGSIPLFWHQSGLNYRPPPILSRTDEENQEAFSKHFLNLMKTYETNQVIAIDCTEHSGREKAIHDAFKRHMERLKETFPNVQLIEFDFHRHCRRRQCSDSQVERHLKSCGLTDQLLKSTKYYWNDGEVVWEQDGLFRVNCLDCTDRTNVVQRCVALQVLDFQLARLGIIPPETSFEDNEYRRIMKQMWSSNGNVLSTQYCGTRALFTGDKKISGLLQDTYSSASRYYISKFRDSYRQAAIDAMLGVESPTPPPHQILDPNQQSQSQGSSGFHSYMTKSPSLPFDKLDLMEPFLASRAAGNALLKDVGNRVSNRLARLRGKFNANNHAPDWGTVNMSRITRASNITTAGRAASHDDIDDDEHGCEAVEAKINLGHMNIDWPSSSESISEQANCNIDNIKNNNNNNINNNNDSNNKEDKNNRLESKRNRRHKVREEEEGVGEGKEAEDVEEDEGEINEEEEEEDNYQDDDDFSHLMLSIDLAELQRLRSAGSTAATVVDSQQPAKDDDESNENNITTVSSHSHHHQQQLETQQQHHDNNNMDIGCKPSSNV